MTGHSTSILRSLLTGGLCLAAVLVVHRLAIVPLQERDQEARGKIGDLHERMEAAGRALDDLRALRQRAAAAETELERFRGELPSGPALVWFPERIKRHFAESRIVVSSVRLNAKEPASGLPGCERAYWHVVVPLSTTEHGIPGLLLALTELEKREPFVRVLDFAIKADLADPRRGSAGMNIAALNGQETD